MSDSKISLLIVDDNPANMHLLARLFKDRGYKIRQANNGTLALETAQANPPDLILLDVNMPGLSGFEVCRRLKADANLCHIPIIFVSALDETLDKVKAFQIGGADYVTKPFQVGEIQARIESHLRLVQQNKEIQRLREKERDHYMQLNALKDELLQTVSHDLKNPISIISGYVELIRDSGAVQDPEVLSFLDRIEKGVGKMYHLVVDLLDLAHLDAGNGLQLTWVELNGFLEDCFANFEAMAAQKQVNVRLKSLNDELFVQIDIDRMTQVINNLISNALKYTPAQGDVTLHVVAEDERVLIAVEDTGLGIPSESIPHIFEKFYRVPHSKHLRSEGTGLGLSIAKTIVEQHAGEIWVESELDLGSTFYVALPLHNPSTAEEG